MTTYKGNAGHLMQHWTLCELLDIADEHVPGLNFIDAHAMAPCAETLDGNGDRRFRDVRDHLPGQRSIYERAWHQLAARDCMEGYPNSAAFVNQVWTRDFSMLLCEKDPATVTVLDTWLPSVQGQPRCQRAKVVPGDWRKRFEKGLPKLSQVRLPDGSLTLVSFDPTMYSLRDARPTPEKLYQHDIRQTLLTALEDVHGSVIVQLSTYDSARGQAAQNDVSSSVDRILREGRFTLAAKVVLNEDMMSLVYARDISWWAELAELPRRFNDWRPR